MASKSRVFVALVTALLACALGASAASAQSPPTIDAVDSPVQAFQPDSVTVSQGDMVTWEFDQAAATHSVTSTSGNWTIDETRNAGGAAVTRSFNTPGTYTFNCKFHPTMTGTVTVTAAGEPRFDVLVFSRTTGFRHDHIPHTILSIQQQGASENFNVDVYDPALPTVSLPTSPFLSLAELQKYETIVFESTVGHGPGPLNLDTERPNFEAYVRGGGGYVGIHGAADMASTMGSNPWNWYSNLVGGWFVNHPNGRSGFGHCGSCFHTEVVTEDHSHPATAHLPDKWPTVDELYNFDRPSATIRSDVHTLLSLTESSYRFGLNNNVSATTPLMGGDHPIAWCQNWEGGRAFSNILGHARWQYYTKQFTDTILGGIETTAGRKDANCSSYRETRLLIAGEAGAGLTQAAADSAGALLEQARTAYLAKEYATAIPALNAIVELSNDPAAGDAAARAELGRQARDLRVWMQDLNNG
jgi:plastocyanin/type 1 glutamine amidotransferase